jgi:hypothetical protein
MQKIESIFADWGSKKLIVAKKWRPRSSHDARQSSHQY